MLCYCGGLILPWDRLQTSDKECRFYFKDVYVSQEDGDSRSFYINMSFYNVANMHWSGVSCLYLIGCAYTSQKVVIAWPSSRLSHSSCSDLNSMIHVDILFSAPSLRRRILDLWSGNLLNKSQNDSNYTEIIHVEVQVKNGLHLLFHVYFFYEMIQECRNKL